VFAALYAPSVPAAALIDVARAFTPRFEQLGPVVLLDASGLSRLFGSAQELGEHLRDALEKLSPGDTLARIAIASTQTAATLLALGCPGLTVVMPGKEAIALAPLSVSVLDQFEKLSSASAHRAAPGELRRHTGPDLSAGGWHHPRSTHQASRGRRRAPENRLLEILTKWGIRTLGALTALAGPEIHERLGERGAEWQALARGRDGRPMVPWLDDVPFEAALELEWPIEGLEPLSFVLARLLEPLAEQLERADRGAAVLYTSLRLTSRNVFTRTLQLPAPMRDPKTLRTLILLDLESHPPDAPIDIVRIVIEPTPAKVLQWTLLERAQPAPEHVSTLIARLTALMGEGHVGSPRVVDSWKPGAFEMGDFRVVNDDCVASDVRRLSINREIDHRQSPNSHSIKESSIAELKSALRRFRFPVPTRVVVSEGRPVRIQTDRQGFSSGAITQAAGPWRTSGHWWSASAREQTGELRRDHRAGSSAVATGKVEAAFGREGGWDRDEWDVAMTDGTVYRLVVEREVGQWFLEGVMD
jgi:nucleotidyltransferase/DNA polymerase involved in DNA repair